MAKLYCETKQGSLISQGLPEIKGIRWVRADEGEFDRYEAGSYVQEVYQAVFTRRPGFSAGPYEYEGYLYPTLISLAEALPSHCWLDMTDELGYRIREGRLAVYACYGDDPR